MLAGIFEILSDAGAVRALLTWPKFSITSYYVVSRLTQQGVNPRTVIDVGANVGQFTVAAAKLWPSIEIHSFEPLPDCAEKLNRNIKNIKNVRLYSSALGDSPGVRKFNVNAHSHSSSILPLDVAHIEAFPYAKETHGIDLKIDTLDRVFSSEELVGPVLLKLDVQGYEGRVLEGGREVLKQVDFVLLEASFRPMYQGETLFLDLLQVLKEHGFRFQCPVGFLRHPKTGEFLQIDALFVRNPDK